jgi:flagellar M-ring protein FliF
VVEVAVELVTQSETLTENRIDPQERVAISTNTEENTGTSDGSGAGAVTVASNLPESGGGSSSGVKSQTNGTREQVNYEVSQSQRQIVKLPGDLRRISVAVLIDGIDIVAADGTINKERRGADELAALQDLVSSAVGIDTERGDVLTVRELNFLPQGVEGTLAEAGLLGGIGPIDVMQIIQLAVLGFVALVLGLFVLRPILLSRRPPLAELQDLSDGADPLALLGTRAKEGYPALNGVIDDGFLEQTGANLTAPSDPNDPLERLRRLIAERQDESVEILRGWMEQSEEPA